MANEAFLSAGVHIGMKQRAKDMERFIYKIRSDGLSVLNVSLIEERIGTAAKFLSKLSNILIVSRKGPGQKPAVKFAELIGGKASIGRFLPGTITNPSFQNYYEPSVILLTDPMVDKQALKEAVKMRIPVIGLCDTFNETSYIDFVIPCNNKGRKSLAMIYWALARDILKERGQIKSDEEFTAKPEDFEMTEESKEEKLERMEKEKLKRSRGRGGPRRK